MLLCGINFCYTKVNNSKKLHFTIYLLLFFNVSPFYFFFNVLSCCIEKFNTVYSLYKYIKKISRENNKILFTCLAKKKCCKPGVGSVYSSAIYKIHVYCVWHQNFETEIILFIRWVKKIFDYKKHSFRLLKTIIFVYTLLCNWCSVYVNTLQVL